MIVRVRLLGDVRRHLRGRQEPLSCELAEGAAVGDILDELGIPADEDLIVGVDGELADRSTALADGTRVMLVTPMSGGRQAERAECPPSLR